jgi:hypothetical protein
MIKRMFLNVVLLALSMSFAGCDGQQGAAGVTGAQGRQGENGAQGSNGTDGQNGMNGTDGSDGANGVDGADGMDGTDGRDGVDGICANAGRLNLGGVIGLPEEIIEGTTITGLTLDSNVAPTRTLRLSFSGILSGLNFVDNGDNSFSIVVAQGSATTQSALFSVVATDGCTTDTVSFTINGIGAGGTNFTFIHLMNDQVADLWVAKGEEVVGLAADGTLSMMLAPSIIPAGQYAFSVYASNPVATGPEDYEAGALLGTSEVLELGIRENHTLVVYPDVDGNPVFEHFKNDTSAPATDTDFVANVAHFANAAGQVDIINVDTATPLLSDLEFGSASGRVELPSGTYNLGLDVDDDGVSDLVFDPIQAPAGAITTIFAAVVDGAVVLGVFIIDNQAPVLLTIGQVVPSLATDGTGVAEVDGVVIDSFPYPADDAFIGYENDQTLDVENGGVKVFSVDGASQIQLSVTYDLENTYDFLYAVDAMGAQIAEYTGMGSAVLLVPGDRVSLGFDSDESVCTGSPNALGYDPQGYQVQGITFD